MQHTLISYVFALEFWFKILSLMEFAERTRGRHDDTFASWWEVRDGRRCRRHGQRGDAAPVQGDHRGGDFLIPCVLFYFLQLYIERNRPPAPGSPPPPPAASPIRRSHSRGLLTPRAALPALSARGAVVRSGDDDSLYYVGLQRCAHDPYHLASNPQASSTSASLRTTCRWIWWRRWMEDHAAAAVLDGIARAGEEVRDLTIWGLAIYQPYDRILALKMMRSLPAIARPKSAGSAPSYHQSAPVRVPVQLPRQPEMGRWDELDDDNFRRSDAAMVPLHEMVATAGISPSSGRVPRLGLLQAVAHGRCRHVGGGHPGGYRQRRHHQEPLQRVPVSLGRHRHHHLGLVIILPASIGVVPKVRWVQNLPSPAA